MGSMWDKTEEIVEKHDKESGQWIKLVNDGDKVVGVILGEPAPRETYFVNGKFVEPGSKEAAGVKPSLRVMLNIALLETKEVKIIEVGVVTFKDLIKVREKYGLEKWAFEICRHGAKGDKKTTYSVLPECQLTAEQQKEFAALPLHDLAKANAGGEGDGDGATDLDSYDKKSSGEDEPVDPKTATALVGDLKALPREAVDKFLAKFSIAKVKELPSSKVDAARAFIEQLKKELSPAAPAEVDPFE